MNAIQICPSMAAFNSLKGRVDALETKTLIAGNGYGDGRQLVPKETVKDVTSISLPNGLWIVHGWLTMVTSDNSETLMQLNVTTASKGWTDADRTENKAKQAIVHNIKIMNFTTQTTVYLVARNSAVLTYFSYGGLRAVKIK